MSFGQQTFTWSQTMVEEGYIYWITGYPGAGKSTIARQVVIQIRMLGRPVLLLDGDEVRAAISPQLGHNPDERLENAWRMARLASLFSTQGLEVVVATVSLYNSVRDWLRAERKHYREVYVRVSPQELARRNQKGLYEGGVSGVVKNVPGVNLAVDEPRNPELIIENEEQKADFSREVASILSLRTPS